MAFGLRHATSVKPNREDVGPRQLTSSLLPQLFDGIEDKKSVSVLDLGGGTASTLTFFSNLDVPARVIFGDIMTQRHAFKPEQDEVAINFDSAVQYWRDYLDLEQEDRIDYLLMWDYLHYFEPTVIEALSQALQPHLQRTTKAYGFGTLRSDKRISGSRCAVSDTTSVSMNPLKELLPFAHSQQVIAENFICLQITRATLLQEGHLELLFEA